LKNNNFFDIKDNKNVSHDNLVSNKSTKFPSDRNKAQQIIMYEVRRLYIALKNLEKKKKVLEKKVRVYIYKSLYVLIYIFTYINICIHTYICKYIKTCTHI
jgi:hypothetical protein